MEKNIQNIEGQKKELVKTIERLLGDDAVAFTQDSLPIDPNVHSSEEKTDAWFTNVFMMLTNPQVKSLTPKGFQEGIQNFVNEYSEKRFEGSEIVNDQIKKKEVADARVLLKMYKIYIEKGSDFTGQGSLEEVNKLLQELLK